MVILVTQGTIATNPRDLLVPSLQGLAGEDALVVATTTGTTHSRGTGAITRECALLGTPSYRARAQALQHEILRFDAPRRAASLLEQLAQSGKPVLRGGA